MPKTFLKMKIMSLAAEARIIRREEKKWPTTTNVRWGLYSHRVAVVRPEARVALLAYAYLRGRPYVALERAPLTPPNWEKVTAMVARFGPVPKVPVEAITTWSEAGKEAKVAA
jgi:hypothetical protein